MADTCNETSTLPIDRDIDSLSMLRGLSSREPHTRQDTVAQCRSMFQVWYYGLGSPPTPSESQYLDSASHLGGDPSLRRHIEELLPELLRLSMAAPLTDSREKAGEVLDFVGESLHMRLPRPRCDRASNFIRQRDLVPLDPAMRPPPPEPAFQRRRHSDAVNGGDNSGGGGGGLLEASAGADGANCACSHDLSPEQVERSQALLLDHFHEWHRCCNVFHVMAYHPEYLDIFLQSHNFLLQGTGPIGVAERHYLAIMAAARHRCSYLVHLHAIEFLHLNGDPEWLRGLAHASPKMRKLGPLCRLLAHRPWEVTSSVLRSLLSGPDSYSQSEFVHALFLLSHFVALAGFVAGTGVRPELDFPHGHTYRCDSAAASSNGSGAVPSSPAPSSPGMDNGQRLLDLMEAMHDLKRTTDDGLPEERLLQGFETVEQETADIRLSKAASKEALCTESSADQASAELTNFCDEPSFDYKDFHQAKLDSEFHTFRIVEYSWEDHGSCLAEKFLPSVGAVFGKRFETSFNLTYDTMGPKEGIDTEQFRCAVWYYILSIFGMRRDDYDYSPINKLLNIELKRYCKLVACYPDQVTKAHYKSAMSGFKQSEKVHVNLLIMDSRMEASILYGLRALNDHTTEQ